MAKKPPKKQATARSPKPPFKFLYLNDEDVQNYLEYFEGASREGPWRQKDVSEGGFSAGIGAGVPGAQASLGGGKGGRREVEAGYALGPIAAFRRLRDALEEDRLLVRLESCDEDAWQAVAPGAVVEVPVHAGLSEASQRLEELLSQLKEVQRGMDALGGLKNFYEDIKPLAESVGVEIFANDPDSQRTKKQIETFTVPNMRQISPQQRLVLVTRLSGPGGRRFFSVLDTRHLKASVDDLRGEVWLVGKVEENLPPGGEVDLAKLEALPVELSREERRRALRQNKESIGYPAMRVGVIALFR
jgi:hypothetical protein